MKLRVAAPTSTVTIFSRTRRGQPDDFRAHIIHYQATVKLATRWLNEERRSGNVEGKKKVIRLLRRIDLVHSGTALFFFYSLFLFLSLIDEISGVFNQSIN